MSVFTLDNKIARRIGFSPDWTRWLVYVYAPNTVFIADRAETLQMPGSGSTQQGIPYSNQNGPQNFPWRGELWAIGSAPVSYTHLTLPTICSV